MSTRDKERKEKEDVELKPPWELLPYSRDVASGIIARSGIDSGYPDFYLSKGTEEEYKLSDKTITEGFENKAIVPVPASHRRSLT
jgi:hypothetical protein